MGLVPHACPRAPGLSELPLAHAREGPFLEAAFGVMGALPEGVGLSFAARIRHLGAD
jgi:hypothetical protein